MIVTQQELESSLQPHRPFLTLSVLVTSPLQLRRPLLVPHAPLSWDLLYSLVLLTSMLFPSSDLRAFLAHHCLLVLPLLSISQQIQSSAAIHSSVLSVSPTADSH